MKATFKNAVTGATYAMGIESDGTPKLAQAWNLVAMIAKRLGWDRFDIRVVSVN